MKPLFDEDDGECPEVLITRIEGDEVVKIYDVIRAKTRFLVGAPRFFHVPERQHKAIDSVPNAAREVVNKTAEPFHFLVRGMEFSGTPLPDIGVFVFENGVALDYEKGRQWGEKQILAFFELLRHLLAVAGNALISLEESIPEPQRQKFLLTLGEFCHQPATP